MTQSYDKASPERQQKILAQAESGKAALRETFLGQVSMVRQQVEGELLPKQQALLELFAPYSEGKQKVEELSRALKNVLQEIQRMTQ